MSDKEMEEQLDKAMFDFEHNIEEKHDKKEEPESDGAEED